MYFGDWISLEYFSIDPVNNEPGVNGLDDSLAPNRWQAIIWTSNGLVYWYIYASLCLNVFIYYGLGGNSGLLYK